MPDSQIDYHYETPARSASSSALLIDLEDRIVELSPRQGFVVPKGIVHRTRAPQRTVIPMVENA
jgi:hypothetical protein